jgi:uncharacterized protein
MTLREMRDIAGTVAVPHHEPPAVIRRRRIVVTVVLVIGGALLGYSMTRQPGDESFYWLTLALAAVWAVGAFTSGPLHLGCVRFRGRNQRPVISGTVAGVALGGAFLVGGLVAREIPGVREYVTRVLEFANHGPLLLVVLITVINGIAEELFFRGALYAAVPHRPVLVSTVGYTVATLATGNPMLGFAAILLGLVVGLERRASGGVLAPILTHVTWSTTMLFVLPLIF